MEFTSLSVVITASDETNALRETVQTLLAVGDDVGEIIIVLPEWASEGCTATTDALAAAHPEKVRKLIQTQKGIGGAILDGFDSANGSHLLYTVADLAISLDTVAPMIEIARQHPDDVVKTSRFIQGGKFVDYSPVRLAVNSVAQVFLKILYQSTIRDHTNPMQILPAELYRSIDWHERTYPLLEELVLVPLRLRVPIREVPCTCRGRREGVSKNSFLQTALYLKTALRTRFVPKRKLFKS
jgi:glycosyltransferase involved in cell wall biosynthesis